MSSWTLVRELGIDYPSSADGTQTPRLAFPAAAHHRDDDTYLIVDELAFGKYRSITADCRTLLVDRSGVPLFDSAALGIHDGYGCFSAPGEIALLLRTRWTLKLMSDAGHVRRTLDLSTISKGMPRLVSATWKNTFLLAFHRRVGSVDIAEVDRDGRLLWFLPRRDPALGFAGSIDLLPNDHVLVADEFHHVAIELRRDGSTAWQFGERANPAGDDVRLSNPKAAVGGRDGSYLIADTRNHRVLRVHESGVVRSVQPRESTLCMPAYATEVGVDRVLVCDAGNARVVELDGDGSETWEYGTPIGTRRWFSFPRSVERTGAGTYLVADTANNRVVEVSEAGVRERTPDDPTALFWPRCARSLASGGVLVADGRNARILEVSPAGEIRRELTALRLSGWTPLGDPHDVRLLGNGNLLIVDSLHDLVVESDWEGRVAWVLGEQGALALDDPHSAQALPGGDILICDTGNNRIVRTATTGRIEATLDAVRAPTGWYRLIRPRYGEVAADGTLVIADSDNNRVLGASLDGTSRWELASVPESPLPTLDQPRWLHAIRRDEVVVTDSLHHRILHLRRSPP